MNREELGQHIGYLPQNVNLFPDTVKQNIARMKYDAPSNSIIEASLLAGVHDMILYLPSGYDTIIGQGGVALSGGQKQRIALARAFYGDPKLIVLDEPNSNLDKVGEIALKEALLKVKSKKITSIIISHRTSILDVADKVLLMKEGRIAMFGSKDEVLPKIYKMQPDQNKEEG